MLTLSRKVGEKIVIDGDIILEVKAIENTIVRLGFVAPQQVVILRKELYDRDQRDRDECPVGQ